MKRRTRIALAAFTALLLHGCSGEQWQGFVYSDSADRRTQHHLGSYDTLEHCRDATLDYLQAHDSLIGGGYECGKGCRPQPGYESVQICETTMQ